MCRTDEGEARQAKTTRIIAPCGRATRQQCRAQDALVMDADRTPSSKEVASMVATSAEEDGHHLTEDQGLSDELDKADEK